MFAHASFPESTFCPDGYNQPLSHPCSIADSSTASLSDPLDLSIALDYHPAEELRRQCATLPLTSQLYNGDWAPSPLMKLCARDDAHGKGDACTKANQCKRPMCISFSLASLELPTSNGSITELTRPRQDPAWTKTTAGRLFCPKHPSQKTTRMRADWTLKTGKRKFRCRQCTDILEQFVLTHGTRPSSEQKTQLLKQLGLSRRQLRYWFDNRRRAQAQKNSRNSDGEISPCSDDFCKKQVTLSAYSSSDIATSEADQDMIADERSTSPSSMSGPKISDFDDVTIERMFQLLDEMDDEWLGQLVW